MHNYCYISLLGLEAFTNYDVAMAARTSAGLGPYSKNERVQTNESCEYFELVYLILNGHFNVCFMQFLLFK